MKRRCLVFCLAFAACGPRGKALKDVLPVQVQRTWTLGETRAADAPELVRSLGLEDAIAARYEGNGSIEIRVYAMRVETSAFELMQKWNQNEGLAFYKGRYFVVAQPGSVDRATVLSFLQALKADLQV